MHLGFLNATPTLANAINPRIPLLAGNRKGKLDLRLLRQIRRYIKDEDIDVVWSVNLYPLLYLYLATRGLGRKVRVIGSSNITEFRNAYERAKMRIYAPIISRLDGFVFGSHQQQALWEERYGLKGDKLHVIHNGVDTAWFRAGAAAMDRKAVRQRYGFDEPAVVIGMVAQFRPEKAHGDLIEAVCELRQSGFDAKLLLVGSGPEQQRIRDLVQRRGVADHVVFAGQLDDVRPALSAMDVFALTSRSVETFSNAALEAMAMELPAVLSDLSGATEMVSNGVNGFVYPPGDVGELKNTLVSLMDSDLRRHFGRTGRRIVEERFSATTMAEQYSKLIRGA